MDGGRGQARQVELLQFATARLACSIVEHGSGMRVRRVSSKQRIDLKRLLVCSIAFSGRPVSGNNSARLSYGLASVAPRIRRNSFSASA